MGGTGHGDAEVLLKYELKRDESKGFNSFFQSHM